jgi:hypothetical protein
LTSKTNYYIDIRVLKPSHEPSAFETPVASTVLPVSRLDWAFAGTTESILRSRRQSSSTSSNHSGTGSGNVLPKDLSMTPVKEITENEASTGLKEKEETKNSPGGSSHHNRSSSSGGTKSTTVRQSTWIHWVDSRFTRSRRTHSEVQTCGNQSPSSPTPDDWVDTGMIYPTDKENESLERGRMPHPDTGIMQDYEELWRDLTPQRVPGECLVSFVMKAENPILGTKGLIIRVGTWCEGIICSGNDIGVERWRFGPAGIGLEGLSLSLNENPPEEENSRWHRIVKIGEMSLPCHVCWEKWYDLNPGDDITSGGLKWEVKEKFIWT